MENAFLKFKAMQFYLYLLEAEKFFASNKLKYQKEKKKERNQKKFQAVKTIIQTIERNGSVTDREKQKYKNIQFTKRGGFTKKFYEDTRI